MKKLTHKDKLKLARKLRLEEARKAIPELRKSIMKTSVFLTDNWKREKKKIEKRVDQVIANQQLAKAKREYQKEQNKGLTIIPEA